ncbi:MAG TPA: EutN/CcmL family microcompartment protein [Polyangia bacterium]|nr:EutN/CcmL family microcompartment protein [Polyangia bacterium]
MIWGRVVGEVWAGRKDARLDGAKLLLVRPHAWYEPAFDTGHLVASDELAAGIGDDVIVCLGQPARLSRGDDNMPVDAAVMAIVDRVELDGDVAGRPGAAPGIRRRLQRPSGGEPASRRAQSSRPEPSK